MRCLDVRTESISRQARPWYEAHLPREPSEPMMEDPGRGDETALLCMCMCMGETEGEKKGAKNEAKHVHVHGQGHCWASFLLLR